MISDKVKKILANANAKKATDVHICVGAPVLYRIGRDLIPATDKPLTPEVSRELAFGLLAPDQVERFSDQLDLDTMVATDTGRYRVNISYNDGNVGAVIRVLPQNPRAIDELGLPSIVHYFAGLTKGLVLITGSTSQGKTTTMSAMINEINTYHSRHIVTIEDPIEYLHTNKKSIVRQREVGKDTASFHSGLRAALRQDPDVIAIGEMRDYETIKIALTAAETGVLVFSTLHIISIDKFIERTLSYAPADDEMHVRYLMADSLQGIVHQELLPTEGGEKRVACEVLRATDAVRNIIRKRGAFHLRNCITTGSREGMIPMRQSVEELVNQGAVRYDFAQEVMANYST